MDVFYVYTYGSSLWLGVQSLMLTISPAITLTLLSPEVREPTVLEEYLSRSLGLALLTIGVLTVSLTGSVTLPSNFSDRSIRATTTQSSETRVPYAVHVLTITMFYQSAVAIFCYTKYNTSYKTAYILGSIGSAIIASIGLWCLLFAFSEGRLSKKGIDKRTSGFPFSNKNSAKGQKKQIKKFS